MAESAHKGRVDISHCGSEVIIACNTLRGEIEHVQEQYGMYRRCIWLESQLHNVPTNLKTALQEAIDSVDDAERILMGYGNCGNVVQGLQARTAELIIPRLDDCISLVFGSQARREQYSKDHHAIYLTDGWMDEGHNIIDEYNRALQRYGEDTAEDVFGMMYEHYETMCYLETGLYDVDALMERTRFIADMLELQQNREPATLSYVERLILGPWDETLFVCVAPGAVVPAGPFMEPGSVL